MEEIIVTGVNPMPLLDLPRSASVINSEDIALSGARNITDLLAQLPNISLKSFSGNSKFTSIDIRGSGDTSVSNVLVLIDGIRVNAADLSGPDFSVLALSQIERIEVIRGGNSVRYGSGASHGVINITTLGAEQGVNGLVKLEAGNFDTYSQQATVSLASEVQSLTAYASSSKNDGYRAHNDLDSEDFLLDYRAETADRWSINAKSYAHSDRYQLPGGLDRNALRSGMANRRDGSIKAGVEGKTDDKSHLLKGVFQASETLSVTSAVQFRERKNQFIFGHAFDLTAHDNRNRITQRSLFGEFIINWNPLNDIFSLSAGYENQNGDYSRTTGGQRKNKGKLNSGKLDGEAHYLYSTIKPTYDLTISVGYRNEQSTNRFQQDEYNSDETSSLCDTVTQATGFPPPFDTITFKRNCPLIINALSRSSNRWSNEAYEANVVYNINDSTNIYSSFSETFRNPNIDELVLSSADLGPQTAERYEAGFKYAGDRLAIDFGYFYFRTKKEILFRLSSGSFGLNINSPAPIIRQGGEVQARVILSDTLELNTNLGYTDALTDQDARVPLVPFVTAAAKVRWQPTDKFNSNISVRHTGARLDGNDNSTGDNTSRLENLPSHTVVDASIRFTHAITQVSRNNGELIFSLGVQNLFNEKYSDIAYSNFIYPAASRNYFGSVSYAF